MRARRQAAVTLLMALLTVPSALTGCSKAASPAPPNRGVPPTAPSVTPPKTQPPPEPPKQQEPVKRPAWLTPVTDDNFADVVAKHHPNEMGRVLILEYHDFKDVEERWARRRDNFRKDLETLYARGYRAVNLLDYLDDKLPLPAGTSPVIFTFDDSLINQLKLIQKEGKWEADPQSAVGMMLQFKQAHPDFGAAGTFYVNFTPVPFREPDNWQAKLRFLQDHGFEVANHTMYHEDLSKLGDEDVRKNLAEEVKRIREVLPGYDGSTFALPFGIWPKNKALAISGEWAGVKYKHRAVLLVGADPAYSRYDKRLDVMALPRVQAIDDEFKRWLPFLEAHRYISDGDPDTISLPEAEAERLNAESVKGKKVRTYKSSL
jgi:peptidoglycan/xylan/chitin deacetylase (PgdA/CDA1 family)